MACHVLYFWHEPVAEMTQTQHCLRAGRWAISSRGTCRRGQKRFPQDGHLLYDSDAEVDELVRAAASPLSATGEGHLRHQRAGSSSRWPHSVGGQEV
jgi:hypothetical protein